MARKDTVNNVAVYSETFVEHEDGWRVRIHDEDGAVVLTYEEFKEATGTYDVNTRMSLGPADFAKILGEQLAKFASNIKENA